MSVTSLQAEGACPVCGNTTTVELCVTNGFPIRTCRVCECDFVSPMPDDRTIEAFYDSRSYFTASDGDAGYSDYDTQTARVLPFFRSLLRRLGPGAGRSVLDVGCGYGTHLALAAKEGWDPHGVEVSAFAREVVSKRYGDAIPVVSSISDLPARPFDLVLMFDVVEHLKHPYALFEDMIRKRVLTAASRLVITTPNARSASAATDPAGWEYRTPPEHLVNYSMQSLLLLVTTVGFTEVDVAGIYEDGASEHASTGVAIDGFMTPYAGLSCEATGFDVAAPQAPASVQVRRERNREEALRLRESPFLRGVLGAGASEAKLRMDAEASRISADRELVIHGLRSEIDSYKQSRLYRLSDTVRGDASLIRKVRQSAWIVGSMLTPTAVKERVLPLVRSPRRSAELRGPGPEPYVVRPAAPARADRPRVAHAIANFMTGGSARLVVDLVERLGGLYEQEVITSFVPARPGYVGLPVHEFRHLRSPRPVLAYLRKFKPEVLHVHFWGDVDLNWYRHVFDAGRQYGCSIVENVNTPVEPFVADFVDRYVFVSEYVRHAFGGTVRDVEVIYPGSDFELFARPEGEPAADDCIGMVYRLEPDKLDDRSIDVFVETLRRRPGTRGLIVGGGSLEGGFRQKVGDAGLESAVEFTGYVRYEDLPALYRRMSVFVAPVWKESFGQVAPFAMSMGLPVAGYDVGALSEILGDTALLARTGDSTALARILVDLLDDPARRAAIGQHNAARAHDLFSLESMVERYDSLYAVMTKSPR